MEWALHSANVLILCSFLVRDLIVLRLLSISAGVLFCLYFYRNDMMEPIIWNVLFSIVNLTQIASHLYRSRKIPLNSAELFLYEKFFPTLNPVEIRALYQVAHRDQADPQQELEFEGLGLVLSGTLECNRRQLNTGSFMGTRSYLSQRPCAVKARSKEALSYLYWQDQKLRAWTSQSTERHNLLLKALSADLLNQTARR